MARATSGGRTMVDFKSRGFSSVADVLRAVRVALGTAAGTFQVSLRNATAGWCQQRALFVTPVPAGTQLTMFLVS